MINIYLDMDGCVCWFEEQCRKVFPNFPKGPVKERTASFLGLTDSEFWHIIDQHGEGFWRDIPDFPWTYDLVNLVKKYDPHFLFLTSPSASHHAASGKVLWLQDRFGKHVKNYVISPRKNKIRLAHSKRDVLIDDYDKTYVEFNHRGTCILFPSESNRNFQYMDDPVKYVEEQLCQLSKQ